ncbi:hypothetical protein SCHPADRAFT_869451 [Schizopora paradoxa]|uniref:BTB domain-containing protein n=1 Tax=Schizopora paradoxa TaxID=27342 RepID=A0A0H2RX67_9AGAM|nr:hypothetical protein SCHPADRAFT_869451 [Schizopora paradoxa]
MEAGVAEPKALNTPPKPHRTLWYSDGNIVLSTDRYLFKVHKSFLARHSSVFEDLFDFPVIDGTDDDAENAGACATTQEMYDGLPLVTLAGDKGEDIAHLLRAVYEPRYYDRTSNKTPLATIIALLQLSTKYDFKDIRGDVVFQISKHYPMDFSDYLTTKDSDEESSLFGKQRWECHIPLLAAAFTAQADVLLPTLYFVASGHSMEDILDPSNMDTLPPDCSRTLLLGREKLRRSLTTLAAFLPTYLAKGVKNNVCRERKPCLDIAIYSRSADFVDACFYRSGGRAIFRSNVVGLGKGNTGPRVCDVCCKYVGIEVDKCRKVIWKHVPSYFELKEWGALKEELEKMTT